MKKVFILLAFLSVSVMAQADVYVLVNSDNTIQSIDGDNSAVIEKGQRKEVLKGNISDYDSLTYADSFYILEGKKVKLNGKKLEDESKLENEFRKKQDRESLINAKIKEIAEAQLVAEGKIEAEVK